MTLPPLDPLEVHTGMLLGWRRTPMPHTPPGTVAGVELVLDQLLGEALAHGPCHVSFSGGRDSSVILAAATRVARRQGLPDPIPLTARYPEHPSTHENDWQEAVVRHLALREWTVLEVTTELDVLGDIAAAALLRHGVYAPTPAHSMILFARRAGRGTLLTGTGGDETLSPWDFRRTSLRELVQLRPPSRALKWVALDALPAPIRHRIMVWRMRAPSLPWLRPEAHRWLEQAWRESSPYQRTWGEELLGMLQSRSYEMTRAVLERFALDEGVRLVEPFFDPRFVRALARSAPRLGYATREDALEALFGDLLPREVLHRSTKATFNSALTGPRARAFAEAWDGRGVDERLVDPEALRAAWLQPAPDVRCLSSLQQAWLAAQ
jgi:asparagine synthase (glutamine-hydrolysing)